MRASEFINEGTTGKIPGGHEGAMPGLHRTRDIGGYDRIYHMNRLGMAMASADGKSTKRPEGMDGGSWVEKYNTVHPYTKEEDMMVRQAMKVVPTESDNTIKDRRSIENPEVNKSSVVKGFAGWK